MHLYTNILGLSIPSYGLMITIGTIIGNLIAFILIKKYKFDFNDFIILEAYCLLGAFIGAKALFILVSISSIDWTQITNLQYLNSMMQGGFVFYGGLIGGLLFIFLGGFLHKIPVRDYITKFIFLIPFIHAFGRIGCFMAGCCYGVPYHGFGSVIYPDNSFALSGIELFPVQLVEASLLLVISGSILFLQLKKAFDYTIEFYFFFYGIVRFILEFYRYDFARGHLGILSTSQWISCAVIIIAILSITIRLVKRKKLAGERRVN